MSFPLPSRHKLTPYHSKSPHLYGLAEIRKPDNPFIPTVSSIDSHCYALSDFLHKILSPLVGNTDNFKKKSEHFTRLIQDINLQNEDYLVKF
jgi:hypothetical protein